MVSTPLEADEEAVSSSWSGEILALDGGRVPLRSSDCFLANGEEQAGDLFSLEGGHFSRERSFSTGERCMHFGSCSSEGVDFRPPCRADFLSLSLSFSLAGDEGLGER